MKNLFETFKQAPFSLDDEAIEWVQSSWAAMSHKERIGHLFILLSRGETDCARLKSLAPAGITRFFGTDAEGGIETMNKIRQSAKIPLLISCDLEGSLMSLPFGNIVPNPLALAAIDDLEATETITDVMAQEALAVGINWSFTPVVDINACFRSAIVATRSFGNDVHRIRRHALKQIEVLQAAGIAATVKHWPGEGYDDRDQHLVTTINPLCMDEWNSTFGETYRLAIKAGVKAVMSAHIALPSYIEKVAPTLPEIERFRPASINPYLNNKLLRDTLGFNGLIVSDATKMGGLAAWGPRHETLPQVIENGCDLILFSDDVEQDFEYLEKALEDGKLSEERLQEAVLRTLALKASLGLHKQENFESVNCPVKGCSEKIDSITVRAPTLVKDVQSILPLSPSKTRRIYVYSTDIKSPFVGTIPLDFMDMLRKEGFEVKIHDPHAAEPNAWMGYDLVIYALAEETLATRQIISFNYTEIIGSFFSSMERPWYEVPTILISFGYPYYLYDIPRVPCVINAYSATETMQRAVLECITGRKPFVGRSPVDAFCGLTDARY